MLPCHDSVVRVLRFACLFSEDVGLKVAFAVFNFTKIFDKTSFGGMNNTEGKLSLP